MKNLAGIDFGTTNSTAAIVTNDTAPTLVPVEDDHVTIPTAIYFSETGGVYFGRDAQSQYLSDASDGRFMRSLKRVLGTSLMQSYGTRIAGHNFKFSDIIEKFVRHLKDKIDTAAGQTIENVVMGRPVHFRDNDPDADARAQEELRQIAMRAGFKNILFQFEPIAAAFAHERLLTSEKLAMVIDVGGGTSDFTVIRLGPDLMNKTNRADDILGNTGVRIGGNDFDKSLSLQSFMPNFGMGTELRGRGEVAIPMPSSPYFDLSTWSAINDMYTYRSINNIKTWLLQSLSRDKLAHLLEIIEKRAGHQNLDYVEDAKIKLSNTDQVNIILDFLTDAPTISATRNEFELAIKKDVSKIRKSIEECIKLSGIKNTDIELVILTGGSTEIPYITTLVKNMFPNAELSASDRLSSVGLGLAYDGIRRF